MRTAIDAAGDLLGALRVAACSLPAGSYAALIADLARAGSALFLPRNPVLARIASAALAGVAPG